MEVRVILSFFVGLSWDHSVLLEFCGCLCFIENHLNRLCIYSLGVSPSHDASEIIICSFWWRAPPLNLHLRLSTVGGPGIPPKYSQWWEWDISSSSKGPSAVASTRIVLQDDDHHGPICLDVVLSLLGLMIRINGLFHPLIHGVYWGYNPLTNLWSELPTGHPSTTLS